MGAVAAYIPCCHRSKTEHDVKLCRRRARTGAGRVARTVALRWLPVQVPVQMPVLAEAVRGAVVTLAHVHLGPQAQHALQRRLRVAVNLVVRPASAVGSGGIAGKGLCCARGYVRADCASATDGTLSTAMHVEATEHGVYHEQELAERSVRQRCAERPSA